MKKKLVAFFKKNPGRYFKSKEIAKRLDITEEHEYKSLKAMLHDLFEDEFLQREGKKYKLNNLPENNILTGTLQVNEAGYGFVQVKGNDTGDIFVAARNIGAAFHGDVVEVALFAKQKGKNLEGQVTRIIKRSKREIVGVLQKHHSFYYIKPDNPAIHRDIYVDPAKLKEAKIGDKVAVNKIDWDSSKMNPEGEISEILGKPGSYDTEIISLAKEYNLPYVFPQKVLKEAEEVPLEIDTADINNRADFRQEDVFTIDPADAKDFDDALSIAEKENGNYMVGIHIADVSNYVKTGSDLDHEAVKRGNSVYLVGKVIPMLPEQLSNIICSLVPDKERLTYSVIAELTPRGKLVSYEIKKSIIKSKRRFTYEEVQQIIDAGEGDFSKKIILLNNLAQTLRKKRLKEGSIDFFSPEIKFRLDDEGHPVEIIRKDIKQSNMLVEEFMLLANRIVAKHIAQPPGRTKPRSFVFRVHDLPDNEKIIEFSKFVKSLGYNFNPSESSRSNQFQLLMLAVRGTEEEAVISELAIRSMAKAVYSINNIGHYGLGFKHYTHFTSPIRRYSDLLVHRLLFNYLDGNGKPGLSDKQMEDICDHISITERNAVEAERASIKQKQLEYLQDHIGTEFHGIISGVTHFGMFIKLTETLAEGLIKMRDLDDDFYVYDDKKYSLIGRKTKRQYRLGDKVTVKLIRADLEKSELDFIITGS
jgi:ribonuclease R